MSNPKFFMMVGLVGSGKSTYAKELAKIHNANIHSSDNIREELFGNVNDTENNDKTFQELHRRIKEDLTNGKNTIHDATNLSYKKRIAFLQELKDVPCEKICVLMATPYEKCLEQNRSRERQVPEHVITNMYKNIYIPQLYEGWDDIRIVWNYDKSKFCVNELFNGENGLNKIQQDNPHHQYTIGEHCIRCMLNVEEYFNSLDSYLNYNDEFALTQAALFHDIGKKFTASYTNSKGEITDQCHYYQHHLVSAYDTMFYFRKDAMSDEEILEIVNYIQWHMQPFFIKDDEKAKSKFINLVGQDFYNKLMILHEADLKAH